MLAAAYFKRTRREALYLAWHIAALSRSQRLIELDELLNPKSEAELEAERIEAENAFAAAIETHRKARGEGSVVTTDG